MPAAPAAAHVPQPGKPAHFSLPLNAMSCRSFGNRLGVHWCALRASRLLRSPPVQLQLVPAILSMPDMQPDAELSTACGQRAAAPPPRPRPPTRVHVPPPRLLALASLTHSRAPFCAPGTHADMNNNSMLLWAALLLTPLLAAGQDGELAHCIAPAPLQTTGVLSLPLLLPLLPPVPLCDASALTLNSYCVHCGSSGEQPLVCVAEGGKACKATVKVRASLGLHVLVHASQVCGPGAHPARSASTAAST